MFKEPKLHHAAYASIIVVLLWLITPFVVWKVMGPPTGAGTFGDMYGSVNSLFAGLAFCGIIFTIILQRQELKQNTEELRNSATALRTQALLMKDSAYLNSLPVLIEYEKRLLKELSGLLNGDYEVQSENTVDGYRESMNTINSHIDSLKSRREELRSDLKHFQGESGKTDIFNKSDVDNIKRELGYIKVAIKTLQDMKPSIERLVNYIEQLYSTVDRINSLEVKI